MTPSSLQNISEFPPSIQPAIIEFADRILKELGDNVLSIIVYGSAAGVNYKPGISNINMAVIVRELDFSVLRQGVSLVRGGHKRKIATPLFLTKGYITSSLDVFPVEFTEIKEQHRVIFGEDIFKDLVIPVEDLRLLCEQQIKGKLLHLRQAYLDIGSNPSVLKKLLSAALSDLIPVFRQLIVLKGQKPADQKEQMFEDLSRIFSIDQGSFLVILQDKNKKTKISSHQVEAYFQNFLDQLERLSSHMDTL